MECHNKGYDDFHGESTCGPKKTFGSTRIFCSIALITKHQPAHQKCGFRNNRSLLRFGDVKCWVFLDFVKQISPFKKSQTHIPPKCRGCLAEPTMVESDNKSHTLAPPVVTKLFIFETARGWRCFRKPWITYLLKTPPRKHHGNNEGFKC